MTRYDPWHDIGTRYPQINVVHRDLDGYDGWLDISRLEIVLERRLSQAARRSALAHEIAHLDRGDVCLHESYPDARRQDHRAETAAHAQAARRLIDIGEMSQLIATYGENELDQVADDLWVDLDILLARLDHLHPTERGLIRQALDRKEDAA